MNPIVKTFQLPDGREVSIETGRLAKQADGSVVVKLGDTMLLATVVARQEAGENVDFMPLSVEYREKYAAAGRFPGGFFKRETRPSDHEVLIARLVDRVLRPLFPDDFHAEVQVIITLISADKNTMPDALAGLAASAAIAVSDIPFNGPISEVRVARINGSFVVNPSISDLATADIDILVGATSENIMMVEGEMKEVSEDEMIEALRIAHDAIKVQCQAQTELASQIEKSKVKRVYSHEVNDAEYMQKMHEACYGKIYAMAAKGVSDKHERKSILDAIKEEFLASLSDEDKAKFAPMTGRYYHHIEKEGIRNATLDARVRVDGRKLDQIRPIWTSVDYLPAAHGSAIFTRGETQSLTTVTLGTNSTNRLLTAPSSKANQISCCTTTSLPLQPRK